MMGTLYILVRTYPFWAVPMGLILLTLTMGKQSKKIQKKQRLLYLAAGIIFLSTSGAFLFFGGPTKAVPAVYEAIQENHQRR